MIANNLLNAAAFSPDFLESPSAWVGHLPFANWLMNEIRPAIFVELGTHRGLSYFTFCQSVRISDLATRCYAVDTWQGDAHAGQYGNDVFRSVSTHNDEKYSDFSQLMRMTFDDARTYFADGSIDLLHIDGLHTYEAVRHDFETWLPKLAPGAIVLFHDTAVRDNNFGVWKLWEELCLVYPRNLEFAHSFGLGVLQLSYANSGKTFELLQLQSADKTQIISYFASLGSLQLERYQSKLMIESLNHSVNEHELQIAALQVEILRVKSTTSWQITKPLRLLANLYKLIIKKFTLFMDSGHGY